MMFCFQNVASEWHGFFIDTCRERGTFVMPCLHSVGVIANCEGSLSRDNFLF
jgi:hypothetical protein